MHVLQTLFAHGFHDDFFWIDALCINQDDEERSSQVALMAHIYQQAGEVLVWLGIPKEHEWKTWDELSPKHNHGRPFRRSKRLPAFDLLYSIPELSSSLSDQTRWYERRYKTTLAGQWKQTADICMVPYWERIWIAQEVVVAPKITLLYGRGICEWSRLHALFHVLKDRTKTVDLSTWEYPTKRENGNIFSQIVAVLQSNAVRLSEQRDLYQSKRQSRGSPNPSNEQGHSNEDSSLSLRVLLEALRPSFCSDPRDKVYGMLGMAEDVEAGDIHISYSNSKSLLHLFEDAVLFQQKKHDPKGHNLISFGHILQRSLLAPREKGTWPSAMKVDEFPGICHEDTHFHSRAADSVVQVRAFCIGKISSIFPYDGTLYVRRTAHRRRLIAELNDSDGRIPNYSRAWEDRHRVIDEMPLFPPGQEPSKEVLEMITLFEQLGKTIDLHEVFGKRFPTMWHENSCSCTQTQAKVYYGNPDNAVWGPIFFVAPEESRILIAQQPVSPFDLLCRFEDPSIIAIVRPRECCDTYEVISRALIPPIPLSKIGIKAVGGQTWPTMNDGVIAPGKKMGKQKEKVEVNERASMRHIGPKFTELQLEVSTAILQALTYPIMWKQDGPRWSLERAKPNQKKQGSRPILQIEEKALL